MTTATAAAAAAAAAALTFAEKKKLHLQTTGPSYYSQFYGDDLLKKMMGPWQNLSCSDDLYHSLFFSSFAINNVNLITNL